MLDPAEIDRFRVKPGKKVRLKDFDTGWRKRTPLRNSAKTPRRSARKSC